MRTRHFPVLLEQDKDGVYIVECPSSPGVVHMARRSMKRWETSKKQYAVCLEEADDTRKGNP
jgi:hypothetical protein